MTLPIVESADAISPVCAMLRTKTADVEAANGTDAR